MLPNCVRISLVLSALTCLTLACGGSGGTVAESNPSAGGDNASTHEGESNEASPDDAAAAEPDDEPDTTPVGGEATATGADPQESKLTEQDTFDVNAVLKAHREDLTTCYDDDLSIIELPDDGFLVKAKFTIEADGRVAGAEIVEASQRLEKSEACFLMNLATIKFPPPPEGRVIETTYPFKIKRKVTN